MPKDCKYKGRSFWYHNRLPTNDTQPIQPIKEKSIPFKYYSNPVKISNNEFVVCIHSKFKLMVYNIHSKQWSLHYKYGEEIEEKLEDWTIKTNFDDIETVLYECNNGITIKGDICTHSKNKILVHFGTAKKELLDSDKAYLWIDLPCNKLSQPPKPKYCASDSNVLLSYNTQNGKYYIFEYIYYGELTIIDVKSDEYHSMEWNEYNTKKPLTIINGKIHWLRSVENRKIVVHETFDLEKMKKEKVSELDECYDDAEFIHLTRTDEILLIAKSRNYYIADGIWLFDENKRSWDKVLDIGLSPGVYNEGGRYLLTNDENYWVCLDLLGFEYENIKEWKSAYVIMMGNGRYSEWLEIVVNGFIRNLLSEYGMKKEMRFPGFDVLNLIKCYCENEYIHLLRNEYHLMINIKDVIPWYGTSE